MSDASSAKRADLQQNPGSRKAEDKKKSSSSRTKVPWFNYMKKDESAPEETREIAFLGYN